VRLDRVLGHEQLAADLPQREPGRQQTQDIDLAVAQLIAAARRSPARRSHSIGAQEARVRAGIDYFAGLGQRRCCAFGPQPGERDQRERKLESARATPNELECTLGLCQCGTLVAVKLVGVGESEMRGSVHPVLFKRVLGRQPQRLRRESLRCVGIGLLRGDQCAELERPHGGEDVAARLGKRGGPFECGRGFLVSTPVVRAGDAAEGHRVPERAAALECCGPPCPAVAATDVAPVIEVDRANEGGSGLDRARAVSNRSGQWRRLGARDPALDPVVAVAEQRMPGTCEA
jgi:hypothetical protein